MMQQRLIEGQRIKDKKLNREGREGFWFELGKPADRALAGVTIRTKSSCSAGHCYLSSLHISTRYALRPLRYAS